MTRTHILLFYPDLSRSRANAALARAAATVPGVTVIDMAATRAPRVPTPFPMPRRRRRCCWPPTGSCCDSRCAGMPRRPCCRCGRTRMVYLAFDAEGQRLRGQPVMLAVTAGSRADAYRRGEANLMPLADLLAPLAATANRCGLVIAGPFLLYEANELTGAERDAAAADYARALTRRIDATTPVEV